MSTNNPNNPRPNNPTRVRNNPNSVNNPTDSDKCPVTLELTHTSNPTDISFLVALITHMNVSANCHNLIDTH
jgi:hypothetical protein